MINFKVGTATNENATRAFRAIITQAAHMRTIVAECIHVAKSSASILLTGESGTGKELFARLIHFHSKRADAPFVKVNCAALPANLIESELFGHEKGAFTDAINQRLGRFEMANGGTLLLDEISEIPLTTQTKLLRAIEEYEFQRVGGNETIETDIRIIASSNRDLQQEVRRGNFRLDLYHRLNVVPIRLPALRERIVDIPLLSMHFIDQFKSENSIDVRGLSQSALQLLSSHNWPGNIRELRNAIHRACIITPEELIGPECFSHLDHCRHVDTSSTFVPDSWLHMSLADIERQVIFASIEKFGSKKVAAENLGVTPRTLSNKLKIYDASSAAPNQLRPAA